MIFYNNIAWTLENKKGRIRPPPLVITTLFLYISYKSVTWLQLYNSVI